MIATHSQPHDRSRQRRVAGVMALEAAALATMATLHLTGILAGGQKPFDPQNADRAEAIICVLLAYGASTLMGEPPRRRIARVTIGLAILGFIVGLYFTLQGGDAIDIAFHATMLPLLILTLFALSARTPSRSQA